MLNPRIKLRHLQAFLEVARRRSFARAAQSLAITQPAVSKVIKELEDTLGVTLFERTPQGVALTQAGLTLLRHAGPAVRTLDRGMTAVSDVQERSRWVRVGALSTVESDLIPAAIGHLHARRRDIGVRVITGPSAYLLSRLRLGELDLVVGRMTEAREINDLVFEHLYYEPLVLVARAGHPLRQQHPLLASALSDYPWVVPPPQTTLRQQVDSFCVQHALTLPASLLETLSLSISRRYVLDSDALWTAPRETVVEDLKRGLLCRLDIALETHGGSVGMCLNTSMPSSLALDMFCDILRDIAAMTGPEEGG
ncbi:pca operon transcription factor PcaQ [Phytohalomonas tamaricis]|uniref:pca operon transcription factor PcaQ n=1 Tax=Phytohalomonas tamaricis TaxID=2081032 RepID=UPI000D0B8970|nr:pca operon transcription factor PcaQ [Phytohalomonas tamaricis]